MKIIKLSEMNHHWYRAPDSERLLLSSKNLENHRSKKSKEDGKRLDKRTRDDLSSGSGAGKFSNYDNLSPRKLR